MLKQTLNQTQTLRQQQQLVPQQLQSLEILIATTTELEQKISEELLENPTLEMLESGSRQLVGNPVEEQQDESTQGEAAADVAEKDEALATLIQLNESWRDYVPPAYTGNARYTSEDEEHRQYLFDSLVDEPTLQDILLAQLREINHADEERQRVCEEVIGSIDDKGYLRTSLGDIAMSCDADLATVDETVALIQTFDPPGVGARDLRECLMLQLERQGRKDSLAYQVVSKHLDELARNQIPKISSALRISPSRLYEVVDELKKLQPFPGSLVAPPKTDYVVPEVFVEKDEHGEWTVRTNRDCVPRLRLSPYYMKLMKSGEASKEVKQYIREKVSNSKVLMRALTQRQSTIERITHSLLKFQEDFFENGFHHMRPLVLNEVAEDIGVHETTVSRAIANKYIQTPHGLIPFKHFFSSGIETAEGEMVSSISVKRRIEELVRNEDPKKPLSDQKLTQKLKEDGYKVARRTVAKYREELGIRSSNLRRSY